MNTNTFTNRVWVLLRQIISSKYFLAFTILLFTLQAFWVAVSFRYPLLFDERFHLGAIDYFANQLLPIALSQDPRYDTYGNMAFGSASLYHYFMSLPYKVAIMLGSGFAEQVVLIRLLNIVFAAIGLVLFSKLLREMGMSKAISNLAVFFFSLIPLFVYLSANVSYDNMLFPLTAYFLIICVRLSDNTKGLQTSNYAKLFLVGLVACLIKFTFIPIFTVAVLYVCIRDYSRHRGQYIKKLQVSAKAFSRQQWIIFLLLSIVICSLAAARYAYPVVRYHSVMPSCTATMSKERCSDGALEQIVRKDLEAKKTRDTMSITEFTTWWVEVMSTNYVGSAANTGTTIIFAKNFPVINFLIKVTIIVGLLALIYMWRSLKPPDSWKFMLVLIATLVVTLFLFNATAYYSSNANSTQSRYLLSVMPVIIGMMLSAFNKLLGRRSAIKLGLLVVVVIACTQGAGVVTHLVSSDSRWYWQNPTLNKVNNTAKDVVDPLVFDKGH